MAELPEGPRCPHCASLRLEAVVAAASVTRSKVARAKGRVPPPDQWFNRCRDCGKLSGDYVPTREAIEAALREPPSVELDGHARQGRRVDAELVRRVRAGQAAGTPAKEQARTLGLSICTVEKIRHGHYDACEDEHAESVRVYCPGCRQWITRVPCVLCATLRWVGSRRPPRPSIDPSTVSPALRPHLALPLAALPFAGEAVATRIVNMLEGRDYWTVGQLLAAEPAAVRAIPGLGDTALRQLREALSRLGFRNPPRAAA